MLNVRTLVVLYFGFVYAFSTAYYLFTKKLGSDLRGMPLESELLLMLSFIAVIFCFGLFLVYVRTCDKVIKTPSIKYIDSNLIHVFLLLINLSYVYFSIKYNMGYSGVEVDSDLPTGVAWFYALFQPLYLTYIYAAYYAFSSKKIVLWNVFVMLLLSVSKGWLGPILYFSVIYLTRFSLEAYKYRWRIGLSFVFLFFLAPILRLLKDVFLIYNQRASHDISFRDALTSRLDFLGYADVFTLYSVYMVDLLGRFDHVAITYFSFLTNLSVNLNFSNPFQESWFGQRFFTIINLDGPQRHVASLIQSAYEYQVHLPIPARLGFLPEQLFSLVTYVVIFIPITIFLAKIISKSHVVSNLNWYALFALLYHGWFYSAFLWLQALLIFIVVLLCAHMVNRINEGRTA